MRAGPYLLAAVVAALLYAAFAAGAARMPGEAWFEVAVAILALIAAVTALVGGTGGRRIPRAAWWGVLLLALFAAWSGLTLAWTLDPDRTWEEFNRALSYALIAGLGVLLGATVDRAVERFAAWWLIGVSLVALYALGGKVAPGLHVNGLFDLDQTGVVARLRAPLEYWNALGLFCALAAPMAVRFAVDQTRRRAHRLLALEALYLLALVIGLTYSRGAVLAFVIGGLVVSLFGNGRLRGLIVMALAVLAAAAPLAYAFGSQPLTANGAPLGQRIEDGRTLGLIIVAAALVLLAAGALLARAEPRVRWSGARTRLVFRWAAAGAGVLVLVGAIGLARSQRGLPGSISHVVESFTEVRADKQFDPVRLVSTNSGNRAPWWNEALGAFSDRPLQGWGAGSFALLHLRYRHDTVRVSQAHSVPLQLLAETGLVGLVLGLGGILALLAAALARLRGLPSSPRRDLAIALVATAPAWLIHGLFDWDFNIPAVTAPVLLMLGLVAALHGDRAPFALGELEPERHDGPRLALAGVATVIMAAVVASAVIPLAASEKSDKAAESAANGHLERAAAQADLAARLDPLAVRPLFVAAVVAQRRGRLIDARQDLLEAADRSPEDPQVWVRLAILALQLADRTGYLQATQRIYALDPMNQVADPRFAKALVNLAPPGSSATATGTPLPSG